MKMEILNLGNTAYANYVVSTERGAVLIDCGNNVAYDAFKSKLNAHGLSERDIKYVVLTHVHCDHLSYLSALMQDVKPVLILGEHAKGNIALGHDKLLTYSSKQNKALSEFSAKLRGGPASWKPFDVERFEVVTVCNTDAVTLKDFGATLMPLKGHTVDSIGVLFASGDFFIGDAVMNMFPARHTLPLLIENADFFKATYRTLIDVKAKRYYPGHGKPFTAETLLKNQKYAEALKLF